MDAARSRGVVELHSTNNIQVLPACSSDLSRFLAVPAAVYVTQMTDPLAVPQVDVLYCCLQK